ncbi:MAG: NAD(P)/FAD-dependent oxidoreductase [Deltaproteobacteria bacterium]
MAGNQGENHADVVVIGAGPAGLTAAYELTRLGVPVVVVEQDSQVGGLARTVEYRGFRFDIGGHRFFTKIDHLKSLWQTMLGADLLVRPRLSRIFYRGRFFDYPLKPMNALRNLGVGESMLILGSYILSKISPVFPETSFADWVSNRFGTRLYRKFFESYTEKVWGIPCHTISAQWAAQRIQELSLRTTLTNMFFSNRFKKDTQSIKTLIEEFLYPRLGPGMMWEAFQYAVIEHGGRIELESKVSGLLHDGERVTSVVTAKDGQSFLWQPAQVISSMPLLNLIHALSPPPPETVIAAADSLRYRDFLTVALIIDVDKLFPDNWIYVHDASVRVGRIQNYKNWSPDMVPDQTKTCLGMEYFCTAGDDLWSMADQDLVLLATNELAAIGLAKKNLIKDGVVVRMPKAYPVYDEEYPQAVATIREYLDRFINLQVVGRNGMHRYNNMDHSMLTGMLAVRNLSGEKHDLWGINVDEEYHEIQS